MNLNLVKVNMLVLILVIESNGGLIEGIYGTIKNTTTGLKQDVKNVWSYSKELVGQNVTAAEDEEKRGFIGGIIHSAQEKVHSFQEFWVVEDIPNDSGRLWNMWCRLKQRLEKAKNYILGNEDKPVENNTQPPNEETIVIKDTMDKLFNVDGTRKIDGKLFDEVVENLRKKLTEMRKNSPTTNTPVQNESEGLIDIRSAGVHEDLKHNVQDTAGVGNDIYDKVYDNMNATNDNINKNAMKGMETIKNGVNKVQDRVIGLKDKALDEAVKEKDLLDITYNKLDQDVRNVAETVRDSASNATRLAYP